MNFNKFTLKSQEALQRAQQIAMSEQHQAMELGHILKGLLEVDDSVSPFLFKKLGVNIDIVRKTLDSQLQSYPKVTTSGGQYLSRNATQVITESQQFLKEFGDEFVSIEHLLLAILRIKDPVSQLLKDSGINEKALKAAIQELRKGKTVQSQSAENNYNALSKYSINLNE
ncbi:MAG: Clp protease N-terminal domain-containing protein, partial [Bacteroidota bacterium]